MSRGDIPRPRPSAMIPPVEVPAIRSKWSTTRTSRSSSSRASTAAENIPRSPPPPDRATSATTTISSISPTLTIILNITSRVSVRASTLEGRVLYCVAAPARAGSATMRRQDRIRGAMDTPTFERVRLRVARELVGLSQNQLATQVGLTPAAISQFESGAARPSPDTLAALSAALRVPAGFFAQPGTETHEGFFRSLRRTAVADRRRARAIAHVAHDLALAAATTGRFPASDVPPIPASGLDASLDEIENIAGEVRARWGVPPGPIANLVEL